MLLRTAAGLVGLGLDAFEQAIATADTLADHPLLRAIAAGRADRFAPAGETVKFAAPALVRAIRQPRPRTNPVTASPPAPAIHIRNYRGHVARLLTGDMPAPLSLGWLMLHRRLAGDYETLPASSEAMIHIASIDNLAIRITGEATPTWRGTY